MQEKTGQIWHIYLPEARPGQLRAIYPMEARSLALFSLAESTENSTSKRVA